MWPFRTKKIYKVEYRDAWYDYGCTVVKAYDEANAWRVARKMYADAYQPTTCISIAELRDD